MRKAIREFLEDKLRALELSHAEGAGDRDLPGRIVFGPGPKNSVEAKLHGMLEGLYVAGKINGDEAGDWAARFRLVLAAPGDPGTVFGRIGGSIPAEVGMVNDPWPQESLITSIEPGIPPRDYDTGSLSLTRVELYALGTRLHWRLDLSMKAQSNV